MQVLYDLESLPHRQAGRSQQPHAQMRQPRPGDMKGSRRAGAGLGLEPGSHGGCAGPRVCPSEFQKVCVPRAGPWSLQCGPWGSHDTPTQACRWDSSSSVCWPHASPQRDSRAGSQAQDSQPHAGSRLQDGVGAGLPTLGEHAVVVSPDLEH